MKPLTKDLVLKLKDKNITKKEYDKIVKEIGNRVDDIWHVLLKISKRKLKWYAFRNDIAYSDGNGSDGGTFDIEEDGDFIELSGEYSRNEHDGDFKTGFHTRFLWTPDDEWQKEVLAHVSANKQEIANRKIKLSEKITANKIKRQNIIESIKSKLTKEELKLITFKD